MTQNTSKWKIGLLVFAIISLCAWGGLSWFMRDAPSPAQILVKTKSPAVSDKPTPDTVSNPVPVIGSTMIGADGATLVYVPEGAFTMGSDGNLDEQPVHKVSLNAFWIDQNEVTNTLFSAFVDITGYQTDAENLGWSYAWDDLNWSKTIKADWKHPNGADSNILDKEEHPVVQVSWNDAAAYCQWAGRRLPTEAEWEKAARGTDQRDYPWGNETPNANLLNFLNDIGDTTGVGSYPNGASPYGAYDMAGNVWEWVNDWYRSDYYAAIEDNAPPQGPAYGDGRVLRGGSWINYYSVVRSADRSWSNPMFSFSSYGFRCAWGIVP